MNRRTFVSSLAVAGAAVATGSRLFGADAKAPAKVGLIGCGWFGGVNLDALMRHAGVTVISLCDVNANAINDTLAAVAKAQSAVPKTFSDYREMLASAQHDVVIVATPDHWHAMPAIAAMKAGADVFLEKPIGVDVLEGEALVAAARKYGRVVQVNVHRRNSPWAATMQEKYIRSGRLGTIGAVEGYCLLPMRPGGVIPESAPPAHLDYDQWTGPAPLLPFHAPVESKGWRAFMAYGNGIIGDMGVHVIDQIRYLLGLGWPESISSTGGIYVDKAATADISDTQRSIFRYPGLNVSWEHRTWGVSPIPQRHWTDQWGAHYIGKNGTLTVTMLGYEFTPADGGTREGYNLCSKTGDLENLDFSSFLQAYDDTLRRHVLDFMTARENRSQPAANVEDVHISCASCVLANLAQELGRPLRYDPKTRTIPGDVEATKRLARAYRGSWVHPDPASV